MIDTNELDLNKSYLLTRLGAFNPGAIVVVSILGAPPVILY